MSREAGGRGGRTGTDEITTLTHHHLTFFITHHKGFCQLGAYFSRPFFRPFPISGTSNAPPAPQPPTRTLLPHHGALQQPRIQTPPERMSRSAALCAEKSIAEVPLSPVRPLHHVQPRPLPPRTGSPRRLAQNHALAELVHSHVLQPDAQSHRPFLGKALLQSAALRKRTSNAPSAPHLTPRQPQSSGDKTGFFLRLFQRWNL